jgi:hypothetical protein
MRRLERHRKRAHVSRQTSKKPFHVETKKRKEDDGFAGVGDIVQDEEATRMNVCLLFFFFFSLSFLLMVWTLLILTPV